MATDTEGYVLAINALAIRDTNAHESSVFQLLTGKKTFAGYSTLNQDATMQVYGGFDEDGSVWWPVGSGVTVPTSGDYAYAVLTGDENWPWYKVSLTCGSGPASGTASVYVYAED